MFHPEIKVVYHFPEPFTWKTGQFTVWVNGKQNSRPVNFIPGSRLPCAQTSSVRSRRPETVIKDRFEQTEHEFAFETFCPGNR